MDARHVSRTGRMTAWGKERIDREAMRYQVRDARDFLERIYARHAAPSDAILSTQRPKLLSRLSVTSGKALP